MNIARETGPHTTTTEALIRCAQAAESISTIASLALAARLYVKAWEIDQHAASAATPAASHAGLLEWAAAEQARRDPDPDPDPDPEPKDGDER